MEKNINKILNYLHDQRSYDFTGNRLSMLERRISKRFFPTETEDFEEYFQYLLKNQQELDHLIDILTINVSSFFRDPHIFNHVEKILSGIITAKSECKDHSLRIWSAGCASGEEPYSVALIVAELLEAEKVAMYVNIFATDIDKKAVNKAQKGEYKTNALRDVKSSILNRCFKVDKDIFRIDEPIKNMVNFTIYDLLDKYSFVPPESIFGNFDMALCRNVLIYFNPDFQEKIFDKLYRSLNTGGYLVLGEAEFPSEKYKNDFRRVHKSYKIYQKR
ncbi:protein-glutamate O-methyltransferase CheR [bacterium]|nr:protein-glutamate O-methyltransferase CheR [bacterium]